MGKLKKWPSRIPIPESWRLSADDSHAQKGDSQSFGSEPASTGDGVDERRYGRPKAEISEFLKGPSRSSTCVMMFF